MPRKIWQMPGTDTSEGKLPVNTKGIPVSLGKLG